MARAVMKNQKKREEKMLIEVPGNKKAVSLGDKPPKKQRLPLSMARAVMKNQKKREEKMLIEVPGNKKAVSLGDKPPKKQRLPLSMARAVMKNQKKREEKILGGGFKLTAYDSLLPQNPLLARLGGRNTKQTVADSG
ncbi:hypothetical protein AKJ16_DCAP27643 [Drosera capensis]